MDNGSRAHWTHRRASCKDCCRPDNTERYKRWREQNRDRYNKKSLASYYRCKETPAGKSRHFWRNLKRKFLYQITEYGRPLEPQEMIKDRYRAARALGFRSGLEVRVARELDAQGVSYKYEEYTIAYTRPAEDSRYSPDLVFENGVVVELKGIWDTADRKKLRLVHEQHPEVDLRIVFSNPNTRISKQSKTTYADICKKLGLPFAAKSVPLEWCQEPINHKSIAALEAAQLCHRSSIAKRRSI